MNILRLKGTLTKDPVARTTQSGLALTNFNIAVERKAGIKDYFDITCWRELAENVANHLRTGHTVEIEGQLQNNNYMKDGKKVYKNIITAYKIISTELPAAPTPVATSQSQSNGTYDKQQDPFANPKSIDISEDSLPF